MPVKRHGGSPVVTVALIALCLAFWSMAFFGLEGGLHALLLVELIGAVLDERPWRIGIISGLLFSTRVESVVLLAPVVLVLAFRSDVGEQRRPEVIIRVGTVWLGIVDPHATRSTPPWQPLLRQSRAWAHMASAIGRMASSSSDEVAIIGP